jgi:hypothetical protein
MTVFRATQPFAFTSKDGVPRVIHVAPRGSPNCEVRQSKPGLPCGAGVARGFAFTPVPPAPRGHQTQ